MTASINLFHILIVVPLFLYVYYKHVEKKEPSFSTTVGYILCAILALAFVNFMYQYYLLHTTENKPRGYAYKQMILLLHLLVILPLFMYIANNTTKSTTSTTSSNTKNTLSFTVNRPVYELSLLLLFAALGYHTFNLVRYA